VSALGLPGLALHGQSDLAIDERKISGNAQRRGRRALLHQGTLLYAFELRLMERYLKEPPRQPAYRAGRRHALFVTNAPLQSRVVKMAIAQAWSARPDIQSADAPLVAC
jgi:lipoate-protein ligase A